jgi:DNA-binding XRE family transcriptional regulator
MPTLAATLKAEIRRITSKEMTRALKPLRRLTRQLRLIKTLARAQRRTVAKLERRLARLGGRGGGLRGRRRSMDTGPRISPAAIRTLRRRMKMTRLQFAKAVGVSAGSIFGWETGRSIPRGGSRERLVQLKDKQSVGRGRSRRASGRPRGRRKAA